MNKHHVLFALLLRHLTNGLQERLRFNIAHGAADFANHHVGVCLGHGINAALDFIGHVRNNLNGCTQIIAPALPVQNFPDHSAGADAGLAGQAHIGETLVVAQIQIRFRAVIGDEHFAVLIRAHGAGVHVIIGIELLVDYVQSALLQQPAQRCGANALTQTGYHAACYKYKLRHSLLIPLFISFLRFNCLNYSTVTDFARFFGLSISQPFSFAT